MQKEPHTILESHLNLYKEALDNLYKEELEDRDELLDMLKLARQYVHAQHAIIAAACGHQETIVKPDLDKIDTVIAKATGRP